MHGVWYKVSMYCTQVEYVDTEYEHDADMLEYSIDAKDNTYSVTASKQLITETY